LRTAIEELGDPPVLALTATATPEVIEDVKRQLGRPGMRVLDTGIYRPNLELQVEHVSGPVEKQTELLRLLENIEGSGIVYTATVKHVEEIVSVLQREGFEVMGYHGRLAARRRHHAQERFMAGELKAMVATNAFGMGIDKADIRFVIHYDLPGSLEAYYQEAGRAGRDAEPAHCVLLYDAKDRRVQLFLLSGRYPSEKELLRVYEALQQAGARRAPIGLSELQDKAAPVARSKTRVALSRLKEAGIVRQESAGRFILVQADLRDGRLTELAREWTHRDEWDREKLDRMEAYARSALCRWRLLREYFGEESQERCGCCDNCRKGLAERADTTERTERTEEAVPADHRAGDSHTGSAVGPGDWVMLPKYGDGKVQELDGESIVVRFPGGRTRKFRREFARPVHRSTQKR
jgi:ATP-dependent DNA helicase RecQ